MDESLQEVVIRTGGEIRAVDRHDFPENHINLSDEESQINKYIVVSRFWVMWHWFFYFSGSLLKTEKVIKPSEPEMTDTDNTEEISEADPLMMTEPEKIEEIIELSELDFIKFAQNINLSENNSRINKWTISDRFWAMWLLLFYFFGMSLTPEEIEANQSSVIEPENSQVTIDIIEPEIPKPKKNKEITAEITKSEKIIKVNKPEIIEPEETEDKTEVKVAVEETEPRMTESKKYSEINIPDIIGSDQERNTVLLDAVPDEDCTVSQCLFFAFCELFWVLFIVINKAVYPS